MEYGVVSYRLAYPGGVSGAVRGGGPGVTNTSGPGEGGGGGCLETTVYSKDDN